VVGRHISVVVVLVVVLGGLDKSRELPASLLALFRIDMAAWKSDEVELMEE
jgi:hypothetical protein